MWNEIGSRPAVARDDPHESVWLFGSVCPQRAVAAALVMPWVGSEAMSLHLDAVSKVVTPGAQAPTPCWCAMAPAGTRQVASCVCRRTSPCSRCPATHHSSIPWRTSGPTYATTSSTGQQARVGQLRRNRRRMLHSVERVHQRRQPSQVDYRTAVGRGHGLGQLVLHPVGQAPAVEVEDRRLG